METFSELYDSLSSLYESEESPSILVYTYQDSWVRKQLEDGKTYIASYDRANYSHYKDLARTLGLKNCPIFGALSKSSLQIMVESSGIKRQGKEILQLRIPKKDLKYTEYYDWTDYMYALDDPKSFKKESGISVKDLEMLLRTQKDSIDYDLCQVVFDKIEPEWYKNAVQNHNK